MDTLIQVILQMLAQLPYEVLVIILKKIEPYYIYQIMLTCSFFYNFIKRFMKPHDYIARPIPLTIIGMYIPDYLNICTCQLELLCPSFAKKLLKLFHLPEDHRDRQTELKVTIVNNGRSLYTISCVRLEQHPQLFCSGIVHQSSFRPMRQQYHYAFHLAYNTLSATLTHFDLYDPVTMQQNKDRYRNQFKFMTIIDIDRPFIQQPLYRVVRFNHEPNKRHNKYVDFDLLCYL